LPDAEADNRRELAMRRRMRDDFEFYAERCLKILAKPTDDNSKRELVPFKFNDAQRYVHGIAEKQLAEKGHVRIMVLKGRQQGISTYVEGRFFWKTTHHSGLRAYILTHKSEATENLFAMVSRYLKNAPPQVRPMVGRDSMKTLEFVKLDSQYQVATAGSKGAGRSATLTNVHGSEVAFWEHGEEHLKGMMQAVVAGGGTEVWLETTANGVANFSYAMWRNAQAGLSDFLAVFVPWFWQTEYRRKVGDDFEVSNDRESVPEDELTEFEYQRQYGLDDEQIAWRRAKINELGGGERGFFSFMQEYPATADEAFQEAGARSLISRRLVNAAVKSNVETQGDLIIGVDPAGEGEDGDGTGIIRRRTRRMFNPQLLKGLNTMQLAAHVRRIIKSEKPVKVFIDVGGIGKGTYDRLIEWPDCRNVVVAVNFGSGAYDPETYLNRRAEMYWEMLEWFEDVGGANIPNDPTLKAELLSVFADDDDSQQRKRLKSKKWMRSKNYPSPNLADAGALTFAEPVGREFTDDQMFDHADDPFFSSGHSQVINGMDW